MLLNVNVKDETERKLKMVQVGCCTRSTDALAERRGSRPLEAEDLR